MSSKFNIWYLVGGYCYVNMLSKVSKNHNFTNLLKNWHSFSFWSPIIMHVGLKIFGLFCIGKFAQYFEFKIYNGRF